jgi:hypothetical protein
MVSTQSPLGVLSIVNGYPKREHSRPSGSACCFVFRVPVGYWGTPVEPTRSPLLGRAQRWLDRAARGGVLRKSPNRPIARRIRRRRERPGRRRVRRFRLRRIGGVRRPSPRRRLPCRRTPLHIAAIHHGNGHSDTVIAELLLRGADGAVQDNVYGYCRTAPRSRNRKPQQPRARRMTPKQWADDCGLLPEDKAQYEAGESQVQPAPSQRCWCRRMCLRRSPSALADPAGREATQHSHCN